MVAPEVHRDDRGEFWRSYCRRELAAAGVIFAVHQSTVSVNRSRHTLRGFHFQRPPSTEKKVLTVLTGSAHVVIVDVREGSPTYLGHVAFEFGGGDRRSLIVAEGCATGFRRSESSGRRPRLSSRPGMRRSDRWITQVNGRDQSTRLHRAGERCVVSVIRSSHRIMAMSYLWRR